MRRWSTVPAVRAAILVFAVAGPVGWFLFLSLYSRAPAQDLMVFHTAGKLALVGDWALLRDGNAFTDLLNRTHDAWLRGPLVLHPWVYPPPTLLIAAPLGRLPFALAYTLFVGGSLAVFVAGLWRWFAHAQARPLWILLVLLCPAVAFCLGAGQLSFLIAAVFLFAMPLLQTQNFGAGCLLGLLLVKPQFALMVPVALLAGRLWWAIAGAACSVVVLVLLSFTFGLAPWRDWLHLMLSGDPALAAWMETGRHFGQSVDTYVRLLGGSALLALLFQIAAICVSAACVWVAFAGGRSLQQRAVVLLCAAVFAAPHAGNYDDVLLGTAAVITLAEATQRLLRPGEGLLAIGVWLGTIVNPPALMMLAGFAVLTVASFATPLLTLGLMVTALRAAPALADVRFRA